MELRKWRAIQEKWRANSLYFKMLRYFIVLIIPTFIIGLIVYFGNLALHKQQVIDELDTQLVTTVQTMDMNIRTIEEVALNFYRSETVQQHLMPQHLKSVTEIENTKNVIKELASNRNIMNPYMDDIFVFADQKNVYLSDGMEDYYTFFNEFTVFEKYDEQFWNEMLYTPDNFQIIAPTKVSKAFTNNSLIVIPIVFKQYIRGNQVVMVVTISTNKLLHHLQKSSLHDATRYMITNDDGELIASNMPDSANMVSLLKQQQSGELTQFDQHLIRHYVSDYGWNYYSFTPKQIYFSQAQGVLQLTAWFCVFLFVIGLVLSFVFSYRLYNPIQAILTHHQEQEVFSQVLIENVFHRLLEGNKVEHYEQVLGSIGFTSGQYMAVCIQFQFKDAFLRDIQDTEQEMIFDKLKKVIEGVYKAKLSAHVIEVQRHLFVVMINLKADEEQRVAAQCAEQLTHLFQYDLRYCTLTIGSGAAYANVQGLSDSFDDARMALIRMRLGCDSPATAASSSGVQSEPIANDTFLFSYADENKLLHAVRTSDEETAISFIHTIIIYNIEQHLSITSIHLLLTELYNIAFKYARDKGLAVNELITQEEHRLLSGKASKAGDIMERMEHLKQFYKIVIEQTVDPKIGKTNQLVEQIIEYVEEHYREDLYLDTIADQFSLTAKYISRVFKDSTGRNLTDHISMRRIEEAKKLLATSNLKNDQIAEQIGIISRATFFRLFKKYEGVSPQEYRNSLK